MTVLSWFQNPISGSRTTKRFYVVAVASANPGGPGQCEWPSVVSGRATRGGERRNGGDGTPHSRGASGMVIGSGAGEVGAFSWRARARRLVGSVTWRRGGSLAHRLEGGGAFYSRFTRRLRASYAPFTLVYAPCTLRVRSAYAPCALRVRCRLHQGSFGLYQGLSCLHQGYIVTCYIMVTSYKHHDQQTSKLPATNSSSNNKTKTPRT